VIYGEPPQDVDFVRIASDEVVRVETMKVDGQKILRTEKEWFWSVRTASRKRRRRSRSVQRMLLVCGDRVKDAGDAPKPATGRAVTAATGPPISSPSPGGSGPGNI